MAGPRRRTLGALALIGMGACGRAQPPSPPEYEWPAALAYRLEVMNGPWSLVITDRDDHYRVELDSLRFRVNLGSRAELARVEPDCDASLPACRAMLPSALLLVLRRVMPRLSIWPVVPDGRWMDTLDFDDGVRPRGSRGRRVTSYAPGPDTTIAGRRYWTIRWRSGEEAGMTLVDQHRRLPVYSAWSGGKAYLAGSPFDSLRAGARRP